MGPLVLAVLVIAVILIIIAVARAQAGRAPAPLPFPPAPLPVPPAPCGGCSGALPLCDPATGRCVACTSADTTHCPHGMPYCSGGACKLCRGTAEGCPAGMYCLGGGACVACRDEKDCPPGRVCKPDHSGCVGCLTDANCADPARPYCDAASGTCVACRSAPVDTCGRDSPTRPHCKDGTCTRCLADADCGPGLYCVPAADGGSACVSCVAGDPARQCPAGLYCAGDPAACVECVEGDPRRACPPGRACAGGQCLPACQTSADCGAGSSTPNCIGGVCVACATDGECGAAYPGLLPYCENGLCVECTRSKSGAQEGCPNPATPVCVETVCQQCFRDIDCAGNPGGPFCEKVDTPDGTVYKCVACTSDEYCEAHSPATPHCGVAGHCVRCRGNADCAPPRGLCVAGGTACVQCVADGDCPGGRCRVADGTCVGCLSAGDCKDPAAPFCVGGACVGCDSAHPCPAGQGCTAAGRCAPACYTWATWDPSSGAPPKNAVGPNTLLPAGSRRSPAAPWQLGAVNTDVSGGDFGVFIPTGGASYKPGVVSYLAVTPGCPATPPPAAAPSEAITFHGTPVCGDFVTVLPGVSALTPYTSAGCASWGGALVGKANLLGNSVRETYRSGRAGGQQLPGNPLILGGINYADPAPVWGAGLREAYRSGRAGGQQPRGNALILGGINYTNV